ncbi:MAG: hemolysin family protein [Acutalibacteraceae bacterium]|nr:hemolysin family protein [Acutalibacteraceae bacterium]
MDDPGPNTATSLILKIVLLLVLILINAFFAMSEIAIISLNDAKLEKQAQEGNKKAKKLLKLTSNPSKFLSTIQIGVTLAGFLSSASASQSFVEMLSGALSSVADAINIPMSVVEGFSLVVITLITSYFSLVLGELVPKRVAMYNPEKISFRIAGILTFVAAVTKPFVKVLSLSVNAILRLIGIDPNSEPEEVTEEEIRMMVDVGGEKGVIEDTQKEMINNIFEFDDIDAGDIMTHRTDVSAVEINDPIQDVVEIAEKEGYSRIPVYEESLDKIIGIVYIKDLIGYIGSSVPKQENLRKIMREPYFVPESMKCGMLFQEMTARRVQMAVVVDEYGGTAGIVTLEDLLESIVGNIQDEYDNEEEDFSVIDETTFTVDGTTPIDEVNEHVGVNLPEDEYDTIGGFVISLLGYLPNDGEMNELDYENLHFTILNLEDKRIGKLKVEILPEEDEDDDDEDEPHLRLGRRRNKEEQDD